HDGVDMGQRHVARHRPIGVRKTLAEGRARACGRQRFETAVAQITRGAGVPRIGDDETAVVMEPAECRAGAGYRHCLLLWLRLFARLLAIPMGAPRASPSLRPARAPQAMSPCLDLHFIPRSVQVRRQPYSTRLRDGTIARVTAPFQLFRLAGKG